ncbi:MAG: hypothetical protein AAB875_04310, partial [Patescibacteria group bacterium]
MSYPQKVLVIHRVIPHFPPQFFYFNPLLNTKQHFTCIFALKRKTAFQAVYFSRPQFLFTDYALLTQNTLREGCFVFGAPGRIRTYVGLRPPDLQSGAIDHSAT